MASKTEIANMSISHLGTGKEIANIETEQSQEAKACRRFFDTARDAVLRDFPWPFAEKTSALNLVTTNPNSEWGYSYRYPSDCLKIKRVLTGNRNELSKEKQSYKIGKDSSGKLIFTDTSTLTMEYIERLKDPSFYTPEFTLALSFRLAYYIAPRLTKGDPYKIKNDMQAAYLFELSEAKKNSSNEVQVDANPDSEFIQVRS